MYAPTPPTNGIADIVKQSWILHSVSLELASESFSTHAPRCQSEFTCDSSSTHQGGVDSLKNLFHF